MHENNHSKKSFPKFNKGLFFLFLIFQSEFCFAQELVNWSIGNNRFVTQIMEKTGWLVSQQCFSGEFLVKECMAISFAKQASLKNISRESRQGGKNPGSLLCKTFPNTKVFIAYDDNGNQNSFCLFKDRSFISNSSLVKAALKNDSN